jgi:hypothetical protein
MAERNLPFSPPFVRPGCKLMGRRRIRGRGAGVDLSGQPRRATGAEAWRLRRRTVAVVAVSCAVLTAPVGCAPESQSGTARLVLGRTVATTGWPTRDNSSVAPAAQASTVQAVAAGPAPALPPPPPGVQIDPVADSHDFAVLQKDLGPDFVVQHGVSEPAVRPGTPSAASLPEGVVTALSMSAWFVYGGPASSTICLPAGSRRARCVARVLSNGRRVLVQRPAPVAGGDQPSVSVYFVRSDDVVVQLNLTTAAPGRSANRDGATARWLDSTVDRLGTAATDRGMEPWFFWPIVQPPDRTSDSAPVSRR